MFNVGLTCRTACCLLLLAATNTCFLPVFAAEAPLGPVTLARSHGGAVLVWDATDELAGLIARKAGRAQILRTLESDAARILTQRAPALKNRATSLTVNVIYQRTGAISPVYQVATFEGLERLLLIQAPIAPALRGAAWPRELAGGRIPKPLKITMIGKLPSDLK